HIAREMADHHDVWVLTRSNNRQVIEDALRANPASGLRPVYFDLPAWARRWKGGGRGTQLYYYLWQLGVYRVARRLHRDVRFDLTHHVTFGKYWAPSLLALLDARFVWGPVGGGESAPRPVWDDLGPSGRRYERLRAAARWLGERDPLVVATA